MTWRQLGHFSTHNSSLVMTCSIPSICTFDYHAFFVLNDLQLISVCNPQILCCIVCQVLFHNKLMLGCLPKGRTKRLIDYNKYYDTSLQKRHVYSKHPQECRRQGLFFMQKVKIYESNIVCKKDENNATTSYFGSQHLYNKFNLMQ